MLNKRTLLWVSALAIVLIIIGVGIADATIHCPSGGAGVQNCTTTTATGVGSIIYLIGIIIAFIAWVLGIITTIRYHHWIWFVLVLLFSPLATLAYGFFGPADRDRMRYPPTTPIPPVYS